MTDRIDAENAWRELFETLQELHDRLQGRGDYDAASRVLDANFWAERAKLKQKEEAR